MTRLFQDRLDKNASNFTALTPLSFLQRAATVYPQRTALIHQALRQSWQDTYTRCRQLASALSRAGIKPQDTVSIIAPNTPAMFECHFGVPMAGAVLNTINTRLDAKSIGFILHHAESKLVLVDSEFAPTLQEALGCLPADTEAPRVVIINDPAFGELEVYAQDDYETLLASGDREYTWQQPDDEWDAISLNYTSGTTGNPKGVVYHHRGAALNAINNILAWQMPLHPTYLWTLPMFHCNGWCFPWTLAALAGTSVCLRQVRAESIFELIDREKVSHFCAAPVVLNLFSHTHRKAKPFSHPVQVMTAGAAPPASVIQHIEELGMTVTHTYGLTETYGPAVFCAWQDRWNQCPPDERAHLKARQGVAYPLLSGLMVADSQTLEPVPQDGQTLGEVMFQGNVVMKGYLKNPEACEKDFAGGWFHSGDLAVWHSDGYIEVKDRSKDIIISGGENISSIEIEDVLYQHPAVLEAAVIARPDDKWGEVPCAFVCLKSAESLSEGELLGFCAEHLARFKLPKQVVFGELPKTSTGKIQKFLLRKHWISD